jgi:hypothetical protein
LIKKKAEIRKACREVMVQYEVKLSPPLEDVGEAPPNPRLESQRRKEAVDEFIRRVRQVTGHKIKRIDINRVAGYTDASTFQRWQRMDARSKRGEALKFERALALEPKKFLEKLRNAK